MLETSTLEKNLAVMTDHKRNVNQKGERLLEGLMKFWAISVEHHVKDGVLSTGETVLGLLCRILTSHFQKVID